MNKDKEYSAEIIKRLPDKDGKNILEFIGGCGMIYGGYYIHQTTTSMIKLFGYCSSYYGKEYNVCISVIKDATTIPELICIIFAAAAFLIGIYMCYDAVKTYPKPRAIVKIEKEQKKVLI